MSSSPLSSASTVSLVTTLCSLGGAMSQQNSTEELPSLGSDESQPSRRESRDSGDLGTDYKYNEGPASRSGICETTSYTARIASVDDNDSSEELTAVSQARRSSANLPPDMKTFISTLQSLKDQSSFFESSEDPYAWRIPRDVSMPRSYASYREAVDKHLHVLSFVEEDPEPESSEDGKASEYSEYTSSDDAPPQPRDPRQTSLFQGYSAISSQSHCDLNGATYHTVTASSASDNSQSDTSIREVAGSGDSERHPFDLPSVYSPFPDQDSMVTSRSTAVPASEIAVVSGPSSRTSDGHRYTSEVDDWDDISVPDDSGYRSPMSSFETSSYDDRHTRSKHVTPFGQAKQWLKSWKATRESSRQTRAGATSTASPMQGGFSRAISYVTSKCAPPLTDFHSKMHALRGTAQSDMPSTRKSLFSRSRMTGKMSSAYTKVSNFNASSCYERAATATGNCYSIAAFNVSKGVSSAWDCTGGAVASRVWKSSNARSGANAPSSRNDGGTTAGSGTFLSKVQSTFRSGRSAFGKITAKSGRGGIFRTGLTWARGTQATDTDARTESVCPRLTLTDFGPSIVDGADLLEPDWTEQFAS
ncbi:uncharacterized protein MKK02DRAFT_45007 [Dioszegia hungarica]|uniref:Uncharacterized protein n=1 Tax=Dioszegia hungarica TaxID=4972 RepID=A0AA38H9K4_9TREE|nr:uncharacterized protein MKK02DRAFT_45007 [Dioszegia hungarica]KAI9636303.1 hypothetical protein MKK02DRAFT_45007 [Dioszegia hungarica]